VWTWRVDDFLDLLEDDPHAPEVHNRAHALKDGNGENFSGVSVRTAADDAMVLWRAELAGDEVVVRVIFIGDNVLRP
jgi:predicted membrane-bound spermidine synthase